MLKLSNEIAMEGNVEEALDHFSESFDNSYIDTFCIIIKQSMESGRAVDLLNDMVEQLREVENNILVKKEEKLRRKTGIYQMAFFAGAMVFFIYAFVYDIGKLITNF